MEKYKILVTYKEDSITCQKKVISIPCIGTDCAKISLMLACEPYKNEVDVEASFYAYNTISDTWMELWVYYANERKLLKLT